jgi:hypothetical protein
MQPPPRMTPTRFVIERSVASCLTPRRNCDVEDALTFFYRAFNCCNEVTGYLAKVYEPTTLSLAL